MYVVALSHRGATVKSLHDQKSCDTVKKIHALLPRKSFYYPVHIPHEKSKENVIMVVSLGLFINIKKYITSQILINIFYSESTVVLSSFCLSDLGVDP